MSKPAILSLTVYCPQGSTVHIPVYDGVQMMWEQRLVRVLCPVCKSTHEFRWESP